MINRVVLTGRITRDPEVSQTTSGVAYVRFSIACDRPFKNANGDKQTDFINCIAWRNQAEFIKNYVHKGNLLGIEGRIQVTSYQDQNGNNRQVTEVLVESLDNYESKKNDGGYQPQPPFETGFQPRGQQQVEDHAPETASNVDFEVSSDDLPF